MLWTKKEPQDPGIKDYWQATDAVSRPMAIAMTLLIMFICLAVIFSLFMGGRWLYSNISDKKNQPIGANEKPSGGGITDIGQSASSTTNKSASSSGNANISVAPTSKPTTTPKPTPTMNVVNNNSIPGTGVSDLPNTGPIPE